MECDVGFTADFPKHIVTMRTLMKLHDAIQYFARIITHEDIHHKTTDYTQIEAIFVNFDNPLDALRDFFTIPRMFNDYELQEVFVKIIRYCVKTDIPPKFISELNRSFRAILRVYGITSPTMLLSPEPLVNAEKTTQSGEREVP